MQAGADAVLVSDASVDVTSPKVVRATAGSLFHLPVVTGLSIPETLTALGAAGVRRLAADGFAVAVNYASNQAMADEIVAEIVAAGGQAVASVGDVADWDSGAAMVETALSAFGRLDVLVNNAGFGLKGRFLDNDVEAEQAMLDVLVVAVMRLSHAALRSMTARGTGAVVILQSVHAADAGTVMNPEQCRGQVEGGVAQGIGTALYEEIPYDEQGQPLATTFGDYMVPCAPEIPTVRVAHMVTPALATEYGVKGLGEGGAIGPGAAVASAVNDALHRLGVEICEIPITPRRILEAIAKTRHAA